MARATTPRRTGSGALNLDSAGRRNSFVKRSQRNAIRNQFRRKSNGGMGG